LKLKVYALLDLAV